REALTGEGASVSARDFPDVWHTGGLALPLEYRFEPGADDDGVTVRIPLPVLGRVEDAFDWQIPGLRKELVVALLRTLPKASRRNFVPAPDVAAEALAAMTPGQGRLLDALTHPLLRLT